MTTNRGRHELDEIAGDLSDFKPRALQKAIKQANARFQVVPCHRRIGKTVGAADWIIDKIANCPRPFPRGYFVFPFATQAEEVVWHVLIQLLRFHGYSYTEYKGKLRVQFKHNGGWIQLVGAERYYKHRGKYADAVVFDETPFVSPDAWESVFRPMLSDRMGEALFLFTANGKDWAWRLYDEAAHLPGWSRHKITVWESGILPLEEIEALQRELPEHKFKREFECDFDQAAPGAYFQRQLNALQAEDRIGCTGLHDDQRPVFVTWHLDESDSTAVAVWQRAATDDLHCLWSHRELLGDMPTMVRDLQELGREREWSFERHYCSGKMKADSDRLRLMRKLGLKYVTKGRERPEMDGIAMARHMLPGCRFDEEANGLVDGMRHYHAEHNEHTDTFGGPVQDWSAQWAQLGIAAALNGKKKSDWTQPIEYPERAA